MGVVTLDELRTDLVFDLHNRSDLTDPQLNRWINSAYSWLSQPRVHRHRELSFRYDGVTLATGTDSYALDATTVGRRVNSVRLVTHYLATSITATATRRKLEPRSVQWFYERSNTSGTPSCYVHEGDYLMLYGVPTSAENNQKLRVVYYGEPTPLSDDDDTTLLAPYFDRVLRKGALAFTLEDLGYRDLALEARQEAVALINEVPDDPETDEDTGHEVQVETRSYQ